MRRRRRTTMMLTRKRRTTMMLMRRRTTMTIEKSDSAKVVCWIRETVGFYVFARQTYKKSYEVVTAIVRPMDGDTSWNSNIPGFGLHPILAVEGSTVKKCKNLNKKKGKMTSTAAKEVVVVVVGGEEDSEKKKTLRAFVTPYKANDLVPLLKKAFLDNPDASYVVMKNVLEPYRKQSVFTENLIRRIWMGYMKWGKQKANMFLMT